MVEENFFMKEFWNSATGRRIIVLVILSILLTGFGTAGYMLVQDYSFIEALYMTIITLSTVGFTEVHPLDNNGRIFTIILILMGVSFVAFSLAYFSQILLDGNLLETYRRRRLKKKLDQMENHYIVCGYGEMGQIIVGELHKHKIPVVIIESDESASQSLGKRICCTLPGDATDERQSYCCGDSPCQRFGIGSQQGFGKRIYRPHRARSEQRTAHIRARRVLPAQTKGFSRPGQTGLLRPTPSGRLRIAHNILRPTVTDFLELALCGEGMELSMEEIRIPENSKLVGMELMASGVRSNYDLIVMAIKRAEGTMIFNPAPAGDILNAGDILVVIGAVENLSRFGQDLLWL